MQTTKTTHHFSCDLCGDHIASREEDARMVSIELGEAYEQPFLYRIQIQRKRWYGWKLISVDDQFDMCADCAEQIVKTVKPIKEKRRNDQRKQTD